MEVLKQSQANIMLVLSGICGIIALFVFLTSTISEKRKSTLILLEISAMFLVIADRWAYLYRGDTTSLGWWMVRISNFLVFFLSLVIIYGFNLYLIDLYTHEGGLQEVPKRLRACQIMGLLAMALVVISQFTGIYYTFDAMNRSQRAPGFFLCYLFPLIILLLQVTVIVQYFGRLSRNMSLSLLVFVTLTVIASIVQGFLYGISLNNMAIVAMSALLYVFALKEMNAELDRSRKQEIEHYKDEQKRVHALFEQTAEALATAIDAKDKYTHGHSARVAMYSTQIAREAGKSEEECERIYFAALLHDVGKIGVADSIINKEGRLTDEEFAEIKLHPVYGNQILSTIQQSPYLSIGAHYHHERIDGKGYPEGLKGEDIPEIARIVAVADAYDAMTSRRSYRDTIPQQKVREELVKGMGTQFDPEYAKIMLHLIDLDSEYRMQERLEGSDDVFNSRIQCESIFHDCSLGILLSETISRIHFYSRADESFDPAKSLPVLVVFDALDGRIHEDEAGKKDLLFFEYGRIWPDGRTICEGARRIETKVEGEKTGGSDESESKEKHFTAYEIEAVRYKDHAQIRIQYDHLLVESIIALPDNSRYAYISVTGEHCLITNLQIEQEERTIGKDYIPRIAEEISYIKGCPQGDLPNLEVDGWRTQSTQGVPVRDGMKITFHAKSLPTARLVWHCPFVSIFSSEDGRVDGDNYREFLLLRLDGENWESDDHAENEVRINHTKDFVGWNTWKEKNKEGIDCEVTIRRKDNQIIITTDNLGIALESVTTIKDKVEEVYVGLTGDQCTVTDIRIINPE